MPDFRLTWTIDAEGEPRVTSTVVRSTTPERAVERALTVAVHPSEIEGAELEVVELDDDGLPV